MAVFAVLVLLDLILGAVALKISTSLPDQNEAERWSEDMAMAQVSLFITEDQMITVDDIRRFDFTLRSKLITSGVTGRSKDGEDTASTKVIDTLNVDQMKNPASSVSEGDEIGSLFTTAYSAQGVVTASFENRTMEKGSAIGVGGDFFLFHPLELVTGSYFDPEDVMKDRVLLDEDAAWQLFGSVDIVGESIMIQNVPHYITGVIKKETGRFEEASGLQNGYIYMSYDSLSRYGEIFSGRTESVDISEDGTKGLKGGINCIEVVCPNPVSGLAAKISGESLGLNEENVMIIDNTDRFSLSALFNIIRSFDVRSMQRQAIYYPYWENIARGYEDILARILLIRLISVIICIVIFVYMVIDLYRNKKITISEIVQNISDSMYDFEVRHNKKGRESLS